MRERHLQNELDQRTQTGRPVRRLVCGLVCWPAGVQRTAAAQLARGPAFQRRAWNVEGRRRDVQQRHVIGTAADLQSAGRHQLPRSPVPAHSHQLQRPSS